MDLPTKPLILKPLPYDFAALEPVISAKALKIHYEGHHATYVRNFNKLLVKDGNRYDLEFNYSGHILHERYWDNLAPRNSTSPGPWLDAILSDVYRGDVVKNFLDDLIQLTMKIEGSGWGVALMDDSGYLRIETIPNHSLNRIIKFDPILIIDAWEHNYVYDYENNKNRFFKRLVSIINWDTVDDRIFDNLLHGLKVLIIKTVGG